MAFDLGELLKDVPKLDTCREQIVYIRRDLIEADPHNFYRLSDIEELAANIELCGLQQPIRVRPNPEKPGWYIIVSGHRRWNAIDLLAQEAPEKWEEIPCIVEADAASPALQQLRLIFANASTRKMTDPELAEQAAQVKKLLYRLKEEEGYEFPGRMRDHVAEVVGASKSKLARLEVIQKQLSAVWQPAWKDGTLSENTAYELSKIPKALQTLLYEEKTRTNANLKYLYADDVKKFAERTAAINAQECKIFGGSCGNYENKCRKAATSDRWGWFHCDNKCCKDCPELLRCKRACPNLANTVAKLKADAKAAAKQEAEAKALADKPAIDQIDAIWQRFGLARETAYKEFDDVKKAMSIYSLPYDEKKMMELECGEAKLTLDTYLPFGYRMILAEAARLIAVADLFGCSIDYLLCRTDVKEMATAQPEAPVPNSGTIWHPITEEPPIGVDLVWLDDMGHADNSKYFGGQQLEEYFTMSWPEIRYWAYMPEGGGVE